MSMLLRFAVLVSRKHPFFEWANGFDDGVELTPELDRECRTVYLVSEIDPGPDRNNIIGAWWEEIFEEELFSWMEDEKDWPPTRTREMFDAWFATEVMMPVIDLAEDEPITTDDVEEMELEGAMSECAWCGAEVDSVAGSFVAFKLPDRGRFADREGLTLEVLLHDGRTIVGFMTPAGSPEHEAGDDLIFRVCTKRCERALRSAASKALRRLHRV